MQVLVTGATGFIGSHLAERLINSRHKVTILKRSNSDIWKIKKIFNRLKSYDIDKIDLNEIFKDEKIDLLIHLATSYSRKGERIKKVIESNITFPSVLIETCLKYGLKNIINVDTSAIDTYSFYSSTKKAFLHILNYFYEESELKIINLKLEYVYGPKDDDSKFVPYIIKSILNNRSIDATSGMQKRDFIFVEDVIDAFMTSIDLIKKMNKDSITLEIGTGRSVRLKDFAKIVESLTSKKANIKWGSIAHKKSEIYDSKADLKRAKKVLNWKPKYNLKEGLKKTIDWYMKDSQYG